MIPFDSRDPFPLLDPASHEYAEAQRHAAEVDDWLDLDIEGVEENLSDHLAAISRGGIHQQRWIGLPLQALQTPYTEIRHLLSLLELEPGQKVVDLGAAYGRMAFVIGRHHPGVEFVGYELVSERVIEARKALARFSYENVRLEVADLADPDFRLIEADVYFLYDYGAKQAIAKTLEDLKGIAVSRKITVIGRGRSSRDEIERRQPWLSEVVKPVHFDHFSIYKSRI